MAFPVSRSLCLCVALAAGAAAQAPLPNRAIQVVPGKARPEAQEPREALVIGNGAYADAPLKNPVHDARAMAQVLSEFGFQVTRLENASQQRMEEAIRGFRDRLEAGRGVGLFYFAGHGVNVGGRNYLLPVAQVFESESDVKFKATDAGYVLSAMEDAGARVSLVILDACRNNPFGARSLFRSAAKGLTGMDAPRGSLVAFATAPGSTAADGSGENGLYTGDLVKTIRAMPALEVEQLLKKVSARVQADSGGTQVPFRSSSLTGEFYFRAGAGGPALGAAPAMAPLVGGLQVGVNAPDAKVYVDGELKGSASPARALELRDLPAGTVTVRVEAPGREPREQKVEIQPDQWTQTRMNLAATAAPPAPDGGFTLAGTIRFEGAAGCLAVDPARQRVYIGGGMGQQGLVRIEAANPGAMSQSRLSYGGGIAVDGATGRYATTDGYGGRLLVFNPDDTLYDSAALQGCGGDLAADPDTGRFFISTQCSDHIAVYSQSAKALVASIPAGGVGSRVAFDPASGTIFENLTPNQAHGNVVAPLAVGGTYGTSIPFVGFVQAVNGTLNQLYVTGHSGGGSLAVLDGTSFATLHTFTGPAIAFVIPDEALGRIYTVSDGDRVTSYDAATFARIGAFTLPAAPASLCMARGDDRLYEVAGNLLYVLRR